MRWLQPDTIIPDLSNPQSWNRYSYVTNRPVVANDPTGHYCVGDVEECMGNTEGKGGKRNEKKDAYAPPKPGPRSTLLNEFEFFTDIPWNKSPSPDDGLDWLLFQNYCNRRFGINIECGASQKKFGPPGEININLDAFGFRIEASGWLGPGGADLNIDALYFGRSNQFGLFVSPGGQAGEGGGLGITGGILLGQNLPNRNSYAGPSYTVAGGDIPFIPLAVNIEGEYSVSSPNADGTIPQMTYIGLGPLQPEAGGYSGANVAIPIIGFWDWVTGQ